MIIFNLCLLPGLNKCLFDIGLFHLCSLISLTNSHTSNPFYYFEHELLITFFSYNHLISFWSSLYQTFSAVLLYVYKRGKNSSLFYHNYSISISTFYNVSTKVTSNNDFTNDIIESTVTKLGTLPKFMLIFGIFVIT